MNIEAKIQFIETTDTHLKGQLLINKNIIEELESIRKHPKDKIKLKELSDTDKEYNPDYTYKISISCRIEYLKIKNIMQEDINIEDINNGSKLYIKATPYRTEYQRKGYLGIMPQKICLIKKGTDYENNEDDFFASASAKYGDEMIPF